MISDISKQCLCNVLWFSDAEETIAWMVEKDPMLSTDDYGRDLASVQALQRKHDTLERDLNALEEKVSFLVQVHWLYSKI